MFKVGNALVRSIVLRHRVYHLLYVAVWFRMNTIIDKLTSVRKFKTVGKKCRSPYSCVIGRVAWPPRAQTLEWQVHNLSDAECSHNEVLLKK